MSKQNPQSETSTIFLAMFWGGGGPYTVSEIIHVYDWINRAVPNRLEMETALNTLIAMGLIEREDGKFRIPEPQNRAFDAFRKKKRKNKFQIADMYFRQLPKVPEPSRVIELTEDEYEAHVKAYRQSFE